MLKPFIWECVSFHGMALYVQLYHGDPHPLPGISLRGVAISRLSHALNAVLVAALMWAGAVSFKRVVKEKDNGILVSGANGFIASHIVKQLLEQGYKVRTVISRILFHAH